MKKIISAFLLVCMFFSLYSCTNTSDKQEQSYKTRYYELDSSYLGTGYSAISTYKDKDDTNIKKYAQIAEEVLSYYNKLFDIYFEYSGINNLKTVNKNAGKSPVKVDEEMIVFLEYCKELYTITQGNTNIMLGSVLTLWHNCREAYSDGKPFELFTDAELSAAAEHTSIDCLIIDREASTVYISDPKASIDVGAVAKGYVVDILYDKIKSIGADSVVLNIGGNIRTIGVLPSGEYWEAGLTNPDRSPEADSIICKLKIGESSLVTSGDYQRYFYVGDKKYNHIIDPDTLYPAEHFTSVSIITESSCLGDALSTALFCMTYEEGLALIESIGGVEVIWIDMEYSMVTTPGVQLIKLK